MDPFEILSGEEDSYERIFDEFGTPRVTVIIPSHNHAHLMSITLESVLSQDYSNLEVIVVNASSNDRTLDVIKSFYDDRIRMTTVSTYSRFEMFNKGISLASGSYLNFLLPGDRYIQSRALKIVMAAALTHGNPHLVYGGCLFRDGKQEPKLLLRESDAKLLASGRQPTSLQSCWFHIETFRAIGKFTKPYHLRGGFELLCRFVSDPVLRAISVHHVLTDFTIEETTGRMIRNHFNGTISAIYQHFGLKAAITWLFYQRDGIRLFKILMNKLKRAFFGN